MKRFFSKKRKTGESSSSRDPNALTRDENSKMNKFLARTHTPTRFFLPGDMIWLNIEGEVERLFQRSGIEGLLQYDEPTAPQLTSEFLATLQVSLQKIGSKYEGGLTFSLGGQRCSMTLAEWNSALRLPVNEDCLYESDVLLKGFWKELTGLDSLNWRDCLANKIIHPVFRVSQKVLGNTIFGRAECSKIRKDELKCLYCMVQGRRFDLGVELVLKLQDIVRSSSGTIAIGGMIGRIAKTLNIQFGELEIPDPKYIDIIHLRTIKLVTQLEDGTYGNRLPSGKIVPLTARLASIADKANWLSRWLSDDEDENEDEEDNDEEENSEKVESDSAFDRRDTDMDVGGYSGPFLALTWPSSGRRSYARHRQPSSRPTSARYIVDMDPNSLAEHMAEILQINREMYHHTFGYHFDRTAPYPRPPDWPPQ